MEKNSEKIQIQQLESGEKSENRAELMNQYDQENQFSRKNQLNSKRNTPLKELYVNSMVAAILQQKLISADKREKLRSAGGFLQSDTSQNRHKFAEFDGVSSNKQHTGLSPDYFKMDSDNFMMKNEHLNSFDSFMQKDSKIFNQLPSDQHSNDELPALENRPNVFPENGEEGNFNNSGEGKIPANTESLTQVPSNNESTQANQLLIEPKNLQTQYDENEQKAQNSDAEAEFNIENDDLESVPVENEIQNCDIEMVQQQKQPNWQEIPQSEQQQVINKQIQNQVKESTEIQQEEQSEVPNELYQNANEQFNGDENQGEKEIANPGQDFHSTHPLSQEEFEASQNQVNSRITDVDSLNIQELLSKYKDELKRTPPQPQLFTPEMNQKYVNPFPSDVQVNDGSQKLQAIKNNNFQSTEQNSQAFPQFTQHFQQNQHSASFQQKKENCEIESFGVKSPDAYTGFTGEKFKNCTGTEGLMQEIGSSNFRAHANQVAHHLSEKMQKAKQQEQIIALMKQKQQQENDKDQEIQRESILRKSISQSSVNRQQISTQKSVLKSVDQSSIAFQTPNRDLLLELSLLNQNIPVSGKSSMLRGAGGNGYSPYNITPIGKEDLISMYQTQLKQTMSEMGITTLNNEQRKVIEEFFEKDSKSVFAMIGLGGGKTVLYELMSRIMMSRDLIVVVSHSHLHLPEQMKTKQNNLSWASINSLIVGEQRTALIQLVSQEEVRLLYVTPEIVASDLLISLPQISMLVFEDAHLFCENHFRISANNQYSSKSYFDVLKEKLEPHRMLFIVPWIPIYRISEVEVHCKTKMSRLNEKQTNMTSSNISNPSNDQIYDCPTGLLESMTWSRDDDQIQALVNYLRNPKAMNVKGQSLKAMLYCDSKKVCQDTTNQLNQKGFKANNLAGTKTEFQKAEMSASYQKGNFDIIVLMSNTKDIKILQKSSTHIIHFNMPRSFETYISDSLVSCVSESSNPIFHGFLDDNDYFAIRNDIASDLIESNKIEFILNQLFLKSPQDSGNDESTNIITQSRLFQELGVGGTGGALKDMNSSISMKSFINIVPSQDSIEKTMMFSHQNSSNMKDEASSSYYFSNDLEDSLQSIKTNELCQELEIKRECLNRVLYELETANWIKIISVVPFLISIKPYPGNPEDLSQSRHDLIREIIYISQSTSVPTTITTNSNSTGSATNLAPKKTVNINSVCSYRFNLLDLASRQRETTFELMRQLRKLQNERVISVEINEEVLCVQQNINLKSLDRPEINEQVQEIYKKLRKIDETAFIDLDIMYLSAKTISHLTIEQMLKYSKYKNVSEEERKKQFSHVPKVSSLKEKVKQKFTLYDIYMELLSQQSCFIPSLDSLFELFMDDIQSRFPFVKATAQREKSNVMKDMEMVYNEAIKQKEFSGLNSLGGCTDTTENCNTVFDAQCTFLVQVLKGLSQNSLSISQWRGCTQWAKYSKYDIFEILDIAREYIGNANKAQN